MAIIRVFPAVKPPPRKAPPRPGAKVFPLHPEPWRKDAACATDPDPDAWFPEPGDDPGRAEHALDVCRTRCPVQLACRLYALIRPEHEGIWGGMTRNQRSRMLNESRRRGERGDVA
jgi:Transcription factor WhiB